MPCGGPGKIFLAAFVFATVVICGRVDYFEIDTFASNSSNFSVVVPFYAETLYPWYAPTDYTGYSQGGGVPLNQIFLDNTTDAIGGQRDIILGFRLDNSTGGEKAIAFVADGLLNVSFDNEYAGAMYCQYDGISNNYGYEGYYYDYYADQLQYNLGGEVGLDFLQNYKANGIYFEFTTDVDIELLIEARCGDGTRYSIRIPMFAGAPEEYFVDFFDERWFGSFYYEIPTPLPWFWQDIVGIQFRVPTEAGFVQTNTLASIIVSGYTIEGTVLRDCDCDGNRSPEPFITVEIWDQSDYDNYITYGEYSEFGPFESTLSDINGTFLFTSSFVEPNTTYIICVDDSFVRPCSGTCEEFMFEDFFDTTIVNISITTDNFIVPPLESAMLFYNCSDVEVQDFPNNLPQALANFCNGTSTPINASSFVLNRNCPDKAYIVTYEAGEVILEIEVSIAEEQPLLVSPPIDETVDCNFDNVTERYNTWVGNFGGANITGCPLAVIANPQTVSDSDCLTTNVTFNVTTDCGLSLTLPEVSFTVVDSVNPFFTVSPQTITVDCDFQNQTDFNAYADYITNFGYSEYSDACSNVTVTVTQTPPSRGCPPPSSILFTITDNCGNSATEAGSFIIQDLGPSFQVFPSDLFIECSTDNVTAEALVNSWLLSTGDAIILDDCTGAQILNSNNDWDQTLPSFTECIDSSVVVFTVFSSCGVPNNATASINIVDTEPPAFLKPSSALVYDCDDTSNLFQNWLDTAGYASIFDCTALTISNDYVNPPMVSCNPIKVTFSVCDSCGYCSLSEAFVTKEDNVNPNLTVPDPITINCESQSLLSSIDSWITTATGTDNCATFVVISNDYTSPTNLECSETTVNFQGCDSCGNCAVDSSTIRIIDTTPPFFSSVPTSEVVSCENDPIGAYNLWVSTQGGLIAGDTCSGQAVNISNDAPLTLSNCEVAYVLFTITDTCGLNNFASATFEVIDNIAPGIINPAVNQQVECNPSTNDGVFQQWRSNNGGATAIDNCDTSPIWSNNGDLIDVSSTSCLSDFEVTFSVVDACGNTAATTGTFTVVDTTPPIINISAEEREFECESNEISIWVNENGGASSTDVCSTVTWTNDFIPPPGSCFIEMDVTFTATDVCGLSTLTVGTLFISDSTFPEIINEPISQEIPCSSTSESEYQNWLSSNGGATATDTCISTLQWTYSGGQAEHISSHTVTFRVDDGCGQSVRVTGTFSIFDNESPVFTQQPTDMTVECDGVGNPGAYDAWLSGNANATVTDCGSFFFTNDAPNVGPSKCDSVVVTFIAEDESGNISVATAQFTIQDTFPPVIDSPGSSQSVECDGNGNQLEKQSWIDSNAGIIASDVCSGSNIAIDSVLNNVISDACSSTEFYSFTLTDECGNGNQLFYEFTIVDTLPPTVTSFAQNLTLTCDAGMEEQTLWIQNGGAMATDNCSDVTWNSFPLSGEGEITKELIPFTINPNCFSDEYQFYAIDSCGYTSDAGVASLTRTDNVPPTWLSFPRNAIIQCGAPFSPEFFASPTATDSCGETFVQLTSEIGLDESPIGSCLADFVLTRTYEAFDDCNNFISRNQTIRIIGASGQCSLGSEYVCNCISCSRTPSKTISDSRTPSRTPTKTPTTSRSESTTPSTTKSESSTFTVTKSSTITPTETRTPTSTASESKTSSVTHTRTPSTTRSLSSTMSETETPSKTLSASGSSTISESISESNSASRSFSTTATVTITPTISPSNSVSFSSTASTLRNNPVDPIVQVSVSASATATISDSSSTIIQQNRSSNRTSPVFPPNSSTSSQQIVLGEYESNEQVLLTSNGEEIGSVFIPENIAPNAVEMQLIFGQATDAQTAGANIGSNIIDIELFDENGNRITQLSAPLTICFAQDGNFGKDSCLGFFDVVIGEWVCESSLELVGDQYCGITDHLTSFALLLAGNGGSGTEEFVIAWLSLAAVCCAIFAVMIGVVAVEVRFRLKERRNKVKMDKVKTLLQSEQEQSQNP